MLKKCLASFFICLMVFAVNLRIIRAQADTEAALERNRVERIKTNVYRLESSRNAKIVVKMKSGAKLKGYITKIGDDSFDLTNYKTKQTTVIIYRDVARVEKQGLSKAGKFAMRIIVLAAIVMLVVTLPRNGGPLGGVCPLGC